MPDGLTLVATYLSSLEGGFDTCWNCGFKRV